MAKDKTKAAGDGSDLPSSNAVLDGEIATAAVSTMEARSFERGYPSKPGALSMNQGNRGTHK